ncbi:uncharacterized protein LOC62_01G000949 [Vanrija pseudolonga]|uniref:Uncharacterized protein n=1 Tax=Vanrija pseudolonga TaxID=143232 RepID=A0AAF0Y399_9TREE|nr:hypothetical protein LOC62_01G000949 [Vanrija pseudolonga]
MPIHVTDISKPFLHVERETPFGPLVTGDLDDDDDYVWGYKHLIDVEETYIEKRMKAMIKQKPGTTGAELLTDLMGTKEDASARTNRTDGMPDAVAEAIFRRVYPLANPVDVRQAAINPNQVVALILVLWAMEGENTGRVPAKPHPRVTKPKAGFCPKIEFTLRWCAEKLIELCPDDMHKPEECCGECHADGHRLCFLFSLMSDLKCFKCAFMDTPCGFEP